MTGSQIKNRPASSADDAPRNMSQAANARATQTTIRPIEAFNGASPPAPDWFKQAIGAPRQQAKVEVGGAKINYLTWGERGRPGLLFIHGGRAHAQWWTPFAPFFSDRFRIAAFDISGMGDSDWRDSYSLRQIVDEAFAVSEAAGLCEAGPPIAVGHSFGGYVALAAVETAGERLLGAVIVDSPIMAPNPDEDYQISSKQDDVAPVRPTRVYAAKEEAIKRFRFLPNQPCDNAFLVDHIARTALREAPMPDGGAAKPGAMGWTWKFDPAMGRNFEIHFRRDLFLAARCPLAFIYGARSAFYSPETMAHLRQQTVGRAPIVVIPDAHHHLMMDQPIAFVTALNTLFAAWPVRVGV